jgi:hypothetical protein
MVITDNSTEAKQQNEIWKPGEKLIQLLVGY